MFLQIPTKSYRDQWACFTLTDAAGKTFHVDIVRLTALTTLDGVTMPADGDTAFLTVIDTDTDRLKLADRMVGEMHRRGQTALQWKIIEIVKSWSHGNKRNGRPVVCVDTGESWPSVKACSIANNVSYSQLTNHLQELPGYKTVKGRVYRRA